MVSTYFFTHPLFDNSIHQVIILQHLSLIIICHKKVSFDYRLFYRPALAKLWFLVTFGLTLLQDFDAFYTYASIWTWCLLYLSCYMWLLPFGPSLLKYMDVFGPILLYVIIAFWILPVKSLWCLLGLSCYV